MTYSLSSPRTTNHGHAHFLVSSSLHKKTMHVRVDISPCWKYFNRSRKLWGSYHRRVLPTKSRPIAKIISRETVLSRYLTCMGPSHYRFLASAIMAAASTASTSCLWRDWLNTLYSKSVTWLVFVLNVLVHIKQFIPVFQNDNHEYGRPTVCIMWPTV